MRLLTRRRADQSAQSCIHEVLDPRWDGMSDVGRVACIDHYVCRHCGTRITADKGDPADAAS